jgi:RNA polymerase-interacting CarD/CdnL/TRCF family regulator
MQFQIHDQVIYPAMGVGQIVGLVTKRLPPAESQQYYEVRGQRSTVWVQVDGGAGQGLRRLTRQDELPHFRRVLRGRPADLNADFRQRHLDQRDKIKRGTLQDLCEVVRDLSGRGWRKPLNEADASNLRRSSEALCQEWAAADEVSLEQATIEVNALLREGQHTYQL